MLDAFAEDDEDEAICCPREPDINKSLIRLQTSSTTYSMY
jgi:hypothetical protein